jgi:[protein-PII] uridylyltransferase
MNDRVVIKSVGTKLAQVEALHSRNMQINLEKILLHANETLPVASDAAADSQEHLGRFKRFLKIETERLKIRHRFGLGGGEIANGRSYLVDLVIYRACQLAASETTASDAELSNCAVAALGGYGRRELAPFSDVDILFLHAGRRSKGVKQFVEQTLYLLWDMGLTVGHSFCSLGECVTRARSDLHSRTAMGGARLITGNVHLFRRFVKELDHAVFRNKRETEAFVETLRLELEARYSRFGRAVCVQEPNLKESAGGLRDLHTVLWIGHAKFGAAGLDDLRAQDVISGAEYSAVRRAYDFILRVRNEAHFSTGRRTDLLTLDLQSQIAPDLGYKPKRGLMASELLMRDYYRKAQELHQFCESFLTRVLRPEKRRFRSRVKQVTGSVELRKGKFYLTLKQKTAARHSHESSLEVKQGKLYLGKEPSDFQSSPLRLIDVFSVAQAERVTLSDELKVRLRGNLSLIDRNFRASKEAGRALVALLSRKGQVAAALRMMHETGFLARLLPEFGRITFLVQHDFYHKYTIDEHTLKAVEALDQLAVAHDGKLARYGKVLSEVEQAAPLYLALLLHDVGKGRGSGHADRGARIAVRVCERLGLDRQASEQVVFLVKRHLLMSHLSQRRDLSEEGLIEEFLATVGNLERLNMLFLLTYADTNGVGPEVWNDWKATLLWELYGRARSHLTAGRPVRWDWTRRVLLKQGVIRELIPEYLPSEVERHFAILPDRYLRATKSDSIVRHLLMIKDLRSGPLITEWQTVEEEGCAELTVCTQDSAGLFARLAGTLTACGINILSADLYTREDGLVIDTLRVCEVGAHRLVRAERRDRVNRELKAAIEGRFDVAAEVEKYLAKTASSRKRRKRQVQTRPTVRFDSEASATSTVIEVKAEDEAGLAYKIAATLSRLELNITFAKIATEKSKALDVFYVTGDAGRKLSLAQMAEVERALLEALGAQPVANPNKEAI